MNVRSIFTTRRELADLHMSVLEQANTAYRIGVENADDWSRLADQLSSTIALIDNQWKSKGTEEYS